MANQEVFSSKVLLSCFGILLSLLAYLGRLQDDLEKQIELRWLTICEGHLDFLLFPALVALITSKMPAKSFSCVTVVNSWAT